MACLERLRKMHPRSEEISRSISPLPGATAATTRSCCSAMSRPQNGQTSLSSENWYVWTGPGSAIARPGRPNSCMTREPSSEMPVSARAGKRNSRDLFTLLPQRLKLRGRVGRQRVDGRDDSPCARRRFERPTPEQLEGTLNMASRASHIAEHDHEVLMPEWGTECAGHSRSLLGVSIGFNLHIAHHAIVARTIPTAYPYQRSAVEWLTLEGVAPEGSSATGSGPGAGRNSCSAFPGSRT